MQDKPTGDGCSDELADAPSQIRVSYHSYTVVVDRLARASARIEELADLCNKSSESERLEIERCNRVEAERDSALTRIGELEHRNGVLESKIWGLEAELKMVDGQEIKEANYAMGKARSARNSALAEVETLKAKVEELEGDVEGLTDGEDSMMAECELMRDVALDRVAELDKEASLAEDNLMHARLTKGHWIEQRDSARAEVETLKAEVGRLEGKVARQKRAGLVLIEARKKAEADNRRLREGIESGLSDTMLVGVTSHYTRN